MNDESTAETTVEQMHVKLFSKVYNEIIFQITSETEEAQQKANETVTDVNQLQERVKALQTGFLKNEKDAQEVKNEASSMSEEVKQAQKRAQEMQTEYNRAVSTLEERARNSELAQVRAQSLLEKASQLSLNTTDKLKQLRGKVVTNSLKLL